MIKKILVSQPKPTSEKSPYFDIENKANVEFTFHSFIKVEGLSAREFRQQKIQILDYSAIVFTSRHSVDFFFTLCKEMRVALPEDMKYFGLSEAVSLYIQKYVQYRKRKVFFGTTGPKSILCHFLTFTTMTSPKCSMLKNLSILSA